MSSGAFPILPLHLRMPSSPLYKPSCCFRFSKFFSSFIGSCISRIHRLFASLISSTVRVGAVSCDSFLWFLAAFKFLINCRLRAVTLNSFVASLNCSHSITSVNLVVLIRVGSLVRLTVVAICATFTELRSVSLNSLEHSSGSSSSLTVPNFGKFFGELYNQPGPFHHKLLLTSSDARHPLDPMSAGSSISGQCPVNLWISYILF